MVPHATRGKGASHALAKGYIIYAPKLGYRASVFNLVYASRSTLPLNSSSLRPETAADLHRNRGSD